MPFLDSASIESSRVVDIVWTNANKNEKLLVQHINTLLIPTRALSVLSTTIITASVARKYAAQAALRFAWPPRSHISKIKFLYGICSTLLPTVGWETITSPNSSLYRVVVFPALSKPTCKTPKNF